MNDSKTTVARAQSAGSSAATLGGAIRYLLAHAQPLPGLVAVGTGYVKRTPAVPVRGERIANLVVPLAAAAATSRGDPYAALSRKTMRLTADAKDVAVAALDRIHASAVSRALAAAWPYRRAESRWAGGRHVVSVSVGEPSVVGDSLRVWSSNGKWSGANSSASLCVTRRAIAEFGTGGLIHSGLITLDAERLAPREYRAVWVEQGVGFRLKATPGFMIRGYHTTAQTIDGARRAARKARGDRLLTLLLQRRQQTQINPDAPVTIKDSARAGNCQAGTAAFVARHHLEGVAAIPASALLALADNPQTRAAAVVATLRGGMQ